MPPQPALSPRRRGRIAGLRFKSSTRVFEVLPIREPAWQTGIVADFGRLVPPHPDPLGQSRTELTRFEVHGQSSKSKDFKAPGEVVRFTDCVAAATGDRSRSELLEEPVIGKGLDQFAEIVELDWFCEEGLGASRIRPLDLLRSLKIAIDDLQSFGKCSAIPDVGKNVKTAESWKSEIEQEDRRSGRSFGSTSVLDAGNKFHGLGAIIEADNWIGDALLAQRSLHGFSV